MPDTSFHGPASGVGKRSYIVAPLPGRLDKHPSTTRPFRNPGRPFILGHPSGLGHRRELDSSGVDSHATPFDAKPAFGEEPHGERQQDVFLLEDPCGERVFRIVLEDRDRLLQDDGPPSTDASTKWIVQPETLTP